MTILPCSCWPLAEHALFGQNGFDASLGSVFVCINDSMPMDACFFKPPCSFHRLVESYRPELVEEVRSKAAVNFYMYNASQFMKYAKEFLGFQVGQEAINEVSDIVQQDEEDYPFATPL